VTLCLRSHLAARLRVTAVVFCNVISKSLRLLEPLHLDMST
jgi:hypothetical protein